MTTREELHELIDALGPAELAEVAEVVRCLAVFERRLQPVGGVPASLGIGHSGRGDLSARTDELLAEGGFGR